MVLAFLVGMCLLASCGGEPEDSRVTAEPTETENYDAWIDEWHEGANEWSRAFFSLIKELSENDRSLSIKAVNRAGQRLTTALDALETDLENAGPLDSAAAAPTYTKALAWASDQVRTAAANARSCRGGACSAPVSAMLKFGAVLENLVVKTAAAKRKPSSAARIAPLQEAILRAEDVGGIPLEDRVDPETYLCRPSFEGGDALVAIPPPDQTELIAFGTRDRIPTFHALRRWEKPIDALRYFETLDVRAIVCGSQQRKGDARKGEYDKTWEYEQWVDPAVHTLAWRGVSTNPEDSERTLHSLAVGALVDDTAVTILVLSTRGPVPDNVAKGLLKEAISRLTGPSAK